MNRAADTRYDLCRCGRRKRQQHVLCLQCWRKNPDRILHDKAGEQRLAPDALVLTDDHDYWLDRFTWAEIHEIARHLRHPDATPILEDAA